MPTQDRTNEFKACVDSIRSRSSVPARGPEVKQRLLQSNDKAGGSKSEFSRMASAIGKDISSTSLKLNKLAHLAKRKTLFDDRPVEISVRLSAPPALASPHVLSQELTFIIKQDIAHINKQIAALQAHRKQQNAHGANKTVEGKQIDEHHNNIVMMLQGKLANTSMTFKDVLEVRTQNMKESKDRTEQFMYSTAAAANPTPSNSLLYQSSRNDPMGDGSPSRFDSKGKGREVHDGDILALDLTSAEEGAGHQGAFQQMQMIEQQDSYIQSRTTAIESIESTIAELGQIFTQLANMVAEQRETVQRIDADTMDIQSNVMGAQRELLKYWGNMVNSRWLMLKVFGVLIIFFYVSRAEAQ
ncbi:hypothetical protein C0993_006587 [Termitomyces sp. T159_Od127]|nr:hypothetical protein C0993_006587 [Termitomyces sp. T159_Od127]